MANQDSLAHLKDIHLPEAISWWPLAPGWYVLLFLCLCGISYLIYRVYQNYCASLAKKQALSLLEKYHYHYEKEHNVAITSAQLSELLRRVALVYFPREQVASLHGEAWLAFLNQTSKKLDFSAVSHLLLDAPFKPDSSLDLEPLFIRVRSWIKQRSKPCLN